MEYNEKPKEEVMGSRKRFYSYVGALVSDAKDTSVLADNILYAVGDASTKVHKDGKKGLLFVVTPEQIKAVEDLGALVASTGHTRGTKITLGNSVKYSDGSLGLEVYLQSDSIEGEF